MSVDRGVWSVAGTTTLDREWVIRRRTCNTMANGQKKKYMQKEKQPSTKTTQKTKDRESDI